MRSVLRILDATFNRAREALRVLEDVARFHLDDRAGSAELKRLRHDLDRLARPHARAFLAARNAEGDVGRNGDLPSERPATPAEVTAANFKRAQEAVRTIEETSRGPFPAMARGAHRVRYRLYALEPRVAGPRGRLRAERLCVLLDPDVARGSLVRAARAARRGGAGMFQLRQKPRVDAGLARELRAALEDALFIVNDRADVALAVGADGVHVGREDLPVREAKRLGLPVVGATTHSLGEARRAVRDGADYVSVGPMYATERKPGLAPGGWAYLDAVKRLGVPWFCIGGITRRTVRARMERVAVCGGVLLEKDARAASAAILRRLR